MKGLATLILLVLVVAPANALAGDGATVIFKSGQMILIDNGYGQIVESMKSLNLGKDSQHKIISLDVGGGEFILDLAQVVVVCRDVCKSVTVLHQLDPSRGR